jgi:hypothetical protein
VREPHDVQDPLDANAFVTDTNGPSSAHGI